VFLPDFGPTAVVASAAPAPFQTAFSFLPHGPAATRHELVLVDFDVPERDALVHDLLVTPRPGTTVEVVELRGGGVAEITAILQGRSGLDAVHLVSHGSAGAIYLGTDRLDATTISGFAPELRAWAAALKPDADLLLYGCGVAADPAGRTLVSTLAALTGTDAAASDDPTGAASLGGNWTLEYRAGSIETAALADATGAWDHLLATATFQTGFNGYAGTVDTFIDGDNPTATFGTQDDMFTEGGSENLQGLIRFDNIFGTGPGQIPFGATIQSASLVVYVTNTAADANVAFHRMLTGWSGSSSWASLGNGVQANGVEAVAAPDATFSNTGVDKSRTVTGLAAGVQAWADGAPNRGWVLVGDQDKWGFQTADKSDASLRPRLIVNYTAGSRPVVAVDAYATAEDTPLTVPAGAGLLANDSDPGGGPLTAALAAGPARGTVVVDANGSFTYTPAADFSGTDSFTYTATDGAGGTATGTATITVAPVNDPPTLAPIGNVTITEDAGPQAVALTGIAAGGGEAQGLQVTATSGTPGVVPNPTVSYISPGAAGTLTFRPAADANGTAAITVTARDAGFDRQFGTADDGVTTRSFTITVTPVNDAPTANDDAYATLGGVPLSVALFSGVLANDTDPENDPLTAVLVSGPTNGTLVLFLPNGTFTYLPNLFYTGPDAFTYQTRDSSGALSAPATVFLTVGAGNGPPVSNDDAYATAEDTPLNGTSVLADDADPNGDTLTAVLVAGPANGALVLNADGTFTYTPAANFNGLDSFTYRARDTSGALSAPATVTLTVAPVNDAPAAGNDAATVAEDGTVTVNVLTNDSDEEGDPLTVVSVTPGANGTVTTDGLTVTYTPAADFNGTDSFVYTVGDGNGGLTTATVTVTVTGVDDAPTLDAIADLAVAENVGPQTVTLTGITAGGGEAQPVAVAATSGNPSLLPDPTINYTGPGATGTLTFTPAAGATGTAVVTVVASDGVNTFTRTFTITVFTVNAPPDAADDAYRAIEGGRLLVFDTGVLTNDTDDGGDPLTAVLVTGPANGRLTLAPGGAFVYTPDPGFSGSDAFTYRADDGRGGTAPATVTLTVDPADVRAGTVVFLTTRENQPLDIATAASKGAQRPGAVAVSDPANGTLTWNPDGSARYTPDIGFVGTDSFVYRTGDDSASTTAGSGWLRVVIVVRPANRAPDGRADAYAVAAGGVLVVGGKRGVLANDADPDDDRLTAELLTGAAHGTVTMADDGSFSYTPDPGFGGADAFTYRAFDGDRYSDPITVTIAVRPARATDPAEPKDRTPKPPKPDPKGAVTTTTTTTTTTTAGGVVLAATAVVSTDAVAAISTTNRDPLGGTVTPRAVSDAGRVLVGADNPAAEAAAAPPAAPDAPKFAAPVPDAPKPALPPAAVTPPAPPSTLAAAAGAPAGAVIDSPPPVVALEATSPVFAEIDRAAEDLRAEAQAQTMTDAVVVTGAAATAGYVLLNTRAVYWFLSALLARPAVWRRFDPLDVIYAWEHDQKGK